MAMMYVALQTENIMSIIILCCKLVCIPTGSSLPPMLLVPSAINVLDCCCCLFFYPPTGSGSGLVTLTVSTSGIVANGRTRGEHQKKAEKKAEELICCEKLVYPLYN